MSWISIATAGLGFIRQVQAGSLADIDHVVLFMQENRAWDHYFGTLSGVRGFSDPNVQVNPDGHNVFQQLTMDVNTTTPTLNPWYIAYQGGNWSEAAQCTQGGNNFWQNNHAALNHDLNNYWVRNNTPYSWAHFRRADIPTHFSIAEGWTVADMYQESVIATTNPNRVTWFSGSINCPGGPQSPSQGGVVLDNYGTPGCEAPGLNCFPYNWTTVPEYHQAAGVSWEVYQDKDNFEDDLLTSFSQYQNAPPNSPLTVHGNSYPGLAKFYSDAANGTLPRVSWIVGPAELSEHPPYLPQDGAWLQQQVVEAVMKGKAYNRTALIISYDETGGWGDHVTPFHSPNGTAGEWIQDPYGNAGYTYTGPGFRTPMMIISPWTRGGRVFTEHADHSSQIMFVEQWLQAKGYKNASTPQIPAWRRAHMSNLVNAFDFDHPDYSLPNIVDAPTPSKDSSGKYDGSANCMAKFGTPLPQVPYGSDNANSDPASLSEEGFKGVRGYLTEGRYLVFETNGYALANPGNSTKGGSGQLSATRATSDHRSISQRWILYAKGGTALDGGEGSGMFNIRSAADNRYLNSNGTLTSSSADADSYVIDVAKSGAGYSIANSKGKFLNVAQNGAVSMSGSAGNFEIFSVTYHS